MDTLIYYRCIVSAVVKRAAKTRVEVRYAKSEEASHVASLARAAFTGYLSHYAADPKLDRAKCAEVYAEWAKESVAPGVEKTRVLIARYDGTDVGFGIVRIAPSGEGEAVLAGVIPDAPVWGAFAYKALLFEG